MAISYSFHPMHPPPYPTIHCCLFKQTNKYLNMPSIFSSEETAMIPSDRSLPCFPLLPLLWAQFPLFITLSALLTRQSLGKQWRFSRSLDLKTKEEKLRLLLSFPQTLGIAGDQCVRFVFFCCMKIGQICTQKSKGWGTIHIQTVLLSFLLAAAPQDQALLCHQSQARTRCPPDLYWHSLQCPRIACTEKRSLVFSVNWLSFSQHQGKVIFSILFGKDANNLQSERMKNCHVRLTATVASK